MQVIEVKDSDVEQVFALVRSVSKQTYSQLRPNRWEQWLNKRDQNYWQQVISSEQQRLVMVRIGQQVVGVCSLSNSLPPYSWPVQHLYLTLYCSIWGEGVGSVLLQEQLRYARQIGARGVVCDVAAENQRALRFFAGKGFQKIGAHYGRTFSDSIFIQLRKSV